MGVMKKSAAAFILLGLLVAAPLRATDFSLFNQNARASGLGGAFVAKADNVFAINDNPAGLAFLGGLRFEAAYLVDRRTTTATWPGSGQTFTSQPFQFWGNAALSWQPWPWVTLGFGFFTPYSAKFEWPWTWPGRSLSGSMELDAHYLRPAIAFRLPGNLAVGASLDLVFSNVTWNHEGTLTLDKFPDLKALTYDSSHDASGRGTGFSVGLLWKPHRMLQVGARYQHHVVVEYDGFNLFDSRDVVAPLIPHPKYTRYSYYEFFYFFFKRQAVTSRLTMPQDVAGGVLVTPLPNLSLIFEAQKTAWHEFGSWEFTSVNSGAALNPDFTQEYQDFYGIAPDYGRQGAGLILQDAWTYKGGVEYDLFGRFALRGGLARHESTVAASDLNPVYPDLGRTILTLGFGYQGPFYSIWDRREMGRFSIDTFFQFAWAKSTTASPPSIELTYGGHRWALGISVEFII